MKTTSWLVHRSTWILFVVYVAWAADTLFDIDQPWLDVPVTLVMFSAFAGMIRHELLVCDRCMLDYPEDGSERTLRRLRTLRYYHLYLNLLVLLFLVQMTYAILWITVWDMAAIPGAILFTWYALDYRARAVHRRLQPWCPWCKDWDDSDEDAPVPDPDPSMEKQK